MVTLEELFEWDKVARKKKKQENEKKKKIKKESKTEVVKVVDEAPEERDKIQDKLELALEDDPEEVVCGLIDNWKPCALEGYATPKFEIPVKKSNNYETYKRAELSRVLAFIEYAQKKRIKGGCTAMPIPTTSRKNLMIWGYPKAISRGIEFMKEIGLITVHINQYRFGVPYQGANYGKTYAYFEENEQKVIQYCEEQGIYKYVVKNLEEIKGTEKQILKIESAIEHIDAVKTFDRSAVRFAKGLSLEKPDGVSGQDFEAYLYCCLYLNYPEFALHQMKADEINENFYKDYPEFKLRFRPHFTWQDNKVVKIGIRITNEFCNKEKVERKALLDQYGFHLQHDVRSSVPRLTLSINKGHWVDEKEDVYKLINEEFEPGSNFSEARREAIKHYMLRTYFDIGSDKELGRNVLSDIYKAKVEIPGVSKTEVDELMGRLREAAFRALGSKTFGSDIFYIESCVYLMTLYDLLTSGHMVWLVYDAFYSNGEEDQETFTYMVRSSVRLNFGFFMEQSDFRQFSKVEAVEGEENQKSVSIKDIINKYKIM
jgi:hypothetical protein